MKVILHKLFPYAPYLNEYIGLEDEQRVGETELEGIERLRKLVEQSHKNRYPELYIDSIIDTVSMSKVSNQATNEDSKEDATQRMITAINSCTGLKVLETFKLLVKNNPVFQEAYNNKLKQFQ